MPAVVWLSYRQHANQAGIITNTAQQFTAAEQQLQQFRRQHQHHRQFQPGRKQPSRQSQPALRQRRCVRQPVGRQPGQYLDHRGQRRGRWQQ